MFPISKQWRGMSRNLSLACFLDYLFLTLLINLPVGVLISSFSVVTVISSF